jgi:FdhE protein
MTPWQQRAQRARFLAGGFAAAREILTFYAGLAEWQGGVAPQVSSIHQAVAAIPSLLEFVQRAGPPALAQAARDLNPVHAERLLRDYWAVRPHLSINDFFARAALQPYAAGFPEGLDCPWCAQPPQAGCLHTQGDGLAFEVVCALCLRRRSSPRGCCPACNASSESAVANFTAAEFPQMRVLACENCKGYLLIVDLHRDPAAVPEVDELSALPLDIWAIRNGYHKMQPNIVGV